MDRVADAAVQRLAGRDLASRETLHFMREAAEQPETQPCRLLAEGLPAMVVYGTGPHGRPPPWRPLSSPNHSPDYSPANSTLLPRLDTTLAP